MFTEVDIKLAKHFDLIGIWPQLAARIYEDVEIEKAFAEYLRNDPVGRRDRPHQIHVMEFARRRGWLKGTPVPAQIFPLES